MNRMVARPRRRRSRARATIWRRSATPAATALTGSKLAWVRAASSIARVVLPLPGGPQRMRDGSWFASAASRSTLPGPMTAS